MNIIEQLKTNTSAFGLMGKELREVAEKIGRNNFRYFANNFYRLRADWVCNHREQKKHHCLNLMICSWCGEELDAKPEKKMGWVEKDIMLTIDGVYRALVAGHRIPLSKCVDYSGFGGIQYEAPCSCDLPDREADGSSLFLVRAPEPCEIHGPWIPLKVRFWEEIK